MKAATIVDRSDEIEHLRKRLDHITVTMKSNNYKGARPKRDKKESPTGSGSSSPRRKEDVRKNLKGPATSAAGPFRPDQSNFQWRMGTRMERVCNKGKRRLGEDPRGVRAQGEQHSP